MTAVAAMAPPDDARTVEVSGAELHGVVVVVTPAVQADSREERTALRAMTARAREAGFAAVLVAPPLCTTTRCSAREIGRFARALDAQLSGLDERVGASTRRHIIGVAAGGAFVAAWLAHNGADGFSRVGIVDASSLDDTTFDTSLPRLFLQSSRREGAAMRALRSRFSPLDRDKIRYRELDDADVRRDAAAARSFLDWFWEDSKEALAQPRVRSPRGVAR
jgi:hypothetical protein